MMPKTTIKLAVPKGESYAKALAIYWSQVSLGNIKLPPPDDGQDIAENQMQQENEDTQLSLF